MRRAVLIICLLLSSTTHAYVCGSDRGSAWYVRGISFEYPGENFFLPQTLSVLNDLYPLNGFTAHFYLNQHMNIARCQQQASAYNMFDCGFGSGNGSLQSTVGRTPVDLYLERHARWSGCALPAQWLTPVISKKTAAETNGRIIARMTISKSRGRSIASSVNVSGIDCVKTETSSVQEFVCTMPAASFARDKAFLPVQVEIAPVNIPGEAPSDLFITMSLPIAIDRSGTQLVCPANAREWDGRCLCESGYRATTDGQCIAAAGGTNRCPVGQVPQGNACVTPATGGLGDGARANETPPSAQGLCPAGTLQDVLTGQCISDGGVVSPPILRAGQGDASDDEAFADGQGGGCALAPQAPFHPAIACCLPLLPMLALAALRRRSKRWH